MTRPLLRSTLAAAVLAALAAARPAAAQSASASFQVTANVLRICTISATAIDFGGYDPIGANETAAADQTGTLTIRCTRGTAWSVALDAGLHASGGRRMQHATTTTEYLPYELYSDTSRTAVWDAATPVAGTAANRAPFGLTIYARVPANQDALQGAYGDTVTATVNF